MGHGFGPGGKLYLLQPRRRPRSKTTAKVASHVAAVRVESEIELENADSVAMG